MATSKTLQITSNERVQSILNQVAEAAQMHDLTMNTAEPVSFSAPFCGDEYFTQEIQLLAASETRTHSDFEKCIEEITTIVERELSDGFVETQGNESSLFR